MLYDIKNPTPAQRVIYDGFPKTTEHPIQKAITIDAAVRDDKGVVVPGEKLGVELHESIVKEMQDHVAKNPGSDLIITPNAANKFAAPDQPPKDDARDFPRKK